MKVLISENKLQSVFNNLMLEYSDLRRVERDYDFWDYKRNKYIDYTPINFYDTTGDDENDADIWESDDWVFQYAKEPPYGEKVEGYPTPLLMYSRYRFRNMIKMFGDKFNDLLKEWFEQTYDDIVVKVISDYDSDKFLPI